MSSINFKFIIEHDSDRRHNAKSMCAFISSKPGMQAVLLGDNNQKTDDVSTECYLFIGQKCSEDLMVKSQYSDELFEIGWIGKRAWIRAKKYNFFTRPLLPDDFWRKYVKIYEEMNVQNFDSDVDESLSPEDIFKTKNRRDTWEILSYLTPAKYITIFTSGNRWKKYVYKYAELLFEKEYLDKFKESVLAQNAAQDRN